MRTRPEDGYTPATSSNLFLDRKSNENEREESLNRKIADFLKRVQMMSEVTTLPDEMFRGLESAISNSNFWTHENDFEDADYERVMGQDAMQTPAAAELNHALISFFKEQNFPIIVVVESLDPAHNKNSVLSPGSKNYPNKIVMAADQDVTDTGRFHMSLYMGTSGEGFDPSDVSSGAVASSVGKMMRHELVHASQYEKRKKKQKITRKTALDKYREEGLVPGTKDRRKYLSSHIEIDAYAHEIAEELLDNFGKSTALESLSGRLGPNDTELSDAAREYFTDFQGEKFTKKLKSKIYKNIVDLTSRGIYEGVSTRLLGDCRK